MQKRIHLSSKSWDCRLKKVFFFREIPPAIFEQKGRTVYITKEKNYVNLHPD